MVTVAVDTEKYTAVNAKNAAATAADLGLTIDPEDEDFVQTGTTNKWTYEVSFKVGQDISSTHMNNIETLFSIADKKVTGAGNYITGEVYVGTKSTVDISDEISYKQFMSKYINNENDDADISKSDNGEWLKVVDNDNDGTADYVFLTEFAMAEITSITKKGVYTLTALAKDDAVTIEPEDDEIDSKDIVTEDELAVGDIVIYALIDGVYYVDIADVVTETIDKHGIDSKTETITCDGTVYGQSHIGYSKVMDSDITEALTQETYDLYLDHFGYVRLYEVSDYNRGFVLLTDGYYYTNYRTEEFQAAIYDRQRRGADRRGCGCRREESQHIGFQLH